MERMPYVQIRVGTGFLARSVRIDPALRSGGYPSYDADIISNRSSVRTILFRDDNFRIFTSASSPFHLTEIDGRFIFTANPNAPFTTLGDLQRRFDVSTFDWRSEWANLDTDGPTREGLIQPFIAPSDALQYLVQRGLLFSITVNPLGDLTQGAYVSIDEDRLRYSLTLARFRLVSRFDGYTLQSEDGRYTTCWNVAGACRLILADSVENAVFFNIDYANDNNYRFTYGGGHLTWGQWIFGFFRVENYGVEFSNNPERLARITINDPRVTDTDIYLLRRYFNFTTPEGFSRTFNPNNVTANLPLGGGTCNQNQWEGILQTCYGQRIPYATVTGSQQCTTLADFSEDIHCREWARSNRGPELDMRLRQLCTNVDPNLPDDQRAICDCYRPDQYYYDEIRRQYLERHGDTEATRVANAISRTNLLQCASGLCMQDGTLSAELFYREGRSCDVCIQVATVNVDAEKISGDVKVVQNCTAVRGTFTWEELIKRLVALGAFRVNTGGIYRHVLINSDGTSIKLVTSTPAGQTSLRQFPLLRTLPKDRDGNIVITQEQWSANNVQYSREILEFFFEYIEQSRLPVSG